MFSINSLEEPKQLIDSGPGHEGCDKVVKLPVYGIRVEDEVIPQSLERAGG